MELEILRKLEEQKQAMAKVLEDMPERSRWDRIRKKEAFDVLKGFFRAADFVKKIVEENQEKMALDFGERKDA